MEIVLTRVPEDGGYEYFEVRKSNVKARTIEQTDVKIAAHKSEIKVLKEYKKVLKRFIDSGEDMVETEIVV